MNRPRFSLRALMGVIVVLAAGLAAWRIPWLPLRASALFALVIFVLLTATLGAVLNRGASWIGFALFGWSWLCISFLSPMNVSIVSHGDPIPVPTPIPSMWLLELISSVLGHEHPAADEGIAVIRDGHGGHTMVSCSLVQISHLGSSLLAACIGGVLARWLDGGRPRSSPDDAGRFGRSTGGEAQVS